VLNLHTDWRKGESNRHKGPPVSCGTGRGQDKVWLLNANELGKGLRKKKRRLTDGVEGHVGRRQGAVKDMEKTPKKKKGAKGTKKKWVGESFDYYGHNRIHLWDYPNGQ